jgi:hypothetical protein
VVKGEAEVKADGEEGGEEEEEEEGAGTVKEWIEGLEELLSAPRIRRVRGALEGLLHRAVRMSESGHPAGADALAMVGQLHAPVATVRSKHAGESSGNVQGTFRECRGIFQGALGMW